MLHNSLHSSTFLPRCSWCSSKASTCQKYSGLSPSKNLETWPGGRCPCPQQGCRNFKVIFQVLPTHSLLWLLTAKALKEILLSNFTMFTINWNMTLSFQNCTNNEFLEKKYSTCYFLSLQNSYKSSPVSLLKRPSP